jgi:predicted nucleic acid-binding protein
MALDASDILLDTNVWRYVVDSAALPELTRLVRTCANRIAVAPAVVCEALQTGDTEVRKKLILAMTQQEWRRLMPEAFDEAEEIKAEIRKRPAIPS